MLISTLIVIVMLAFPGSALAGEHMDYFTFGSTLLVFMALVEVIFSSALAGHERDSMARTMDRAAKFIFPSAFLLMFVWFLTGLWKY